MDIVYVNTCPGLLCAKQSKISAYGHLNSKEKNPRPLANTQSRSSLTNGRFQWSLTGRNWKKWNKINKTGNCIVAALHYKEIA